MGTVHVVKTGSVRITSEDTHADLPKHSFGSCAVCARRLQAQQQARPAEQRRARPTTMPTRFLVQTSVVPAAKGGRG